MGREKEKKERRWRNGGILSNGRGEERERGGRKKKKKGGVVDAIREERGASRSPGRKEAKGDVRKEEEK